MFKEINTVSMSYTPARVNMKTGVLEVDEKFHSFPANVQNLLKLHEQGHLVNNSKDEEAAWNYAKARHVEKYGYQSYQDAMLYLNTRVKELYSVFANSFGFGGGGFGGGFGYNQPGVGGGFGYNQPGMGGSFFSDSDSSGWFQGPGWKKFGETMKDIFKGLSENSGDIIKLLTGKDPNADNNNNQNQGGGQQAPPAQSDNTVYYVGGFFLLLMIVAIVIYTQQQKK